MSRNTPESVGDKIVKVKGVKCAANGKKHEGREDSSEQKTDNSGESVPVMLDEPKQGNVFASAE